MDDLPSWNQAPNTGQNLSKDINSLAPLVSTWHGATQGTQIGYTAPKAASQGVLPAFAGKLLDIGKESAHIISSGAEWAGKQLYDMGSSVVKLPVNIERFGMDAYNTHALNSQQTELTQRLDSLTSQYRGGQITAEEYTDALQQWNKDNTNLSKNLQDLTLKIGHDGSSVINNTINATSAVLTVMTAGLTAPIDDFGVKATADFMASDATGALVKPAEDLVAKVAADKSAFSSLSTSVKSAVKDSVTSVLVNSSKNLSASQTSRAVVTNLALKYPLAFAALSGTGKQIYQELQNDKYGDAIKTAAFNAALLLSGGPIGQALKYGGKLISGAGEGVFGSTSFLDELSRNIGDGNPQSLFNAIKDNPELTRNFAALEATNVAATNGDVTKGAFRVLDGLTNAGWSDLSQMSHSDFVEQINNWATAQRMVTNAAIQSGVPEDVANKYVVGRWTQADVKMVAQAISSGDSTESRLQMWENLKSTNPNAAFSNNENLDKQITSMIKRGYSGTSLYREMNGIDVAAGIKGLPSKVTSALAKMGYVAIEPKTLEAPFKEGGAIGSKFAAGDNDFFIKTTQPLPVLGSVGNLLTNMGLSPIASQQRTYELFSSHFANNLAEAGLTKGIMGESSQESADILLRKLSNYTKELPHSLKSPPITDYRQMTLNDIQKALGVSKQSASQVRNALMDSMLQVPLAVRGLGDRVMDANYKYNPLAKGYSRLQGALRFAWNPFFKAKLSYKAEFLSQIEAGGKFPTLAGTNKILQTVMPEKYNQLDDITRTLESKGIFGADYTRGNFASSGYGDEAVDNAGPAGNTVGHALLTGQKRAVSGLVGVMADKAGMSVDEFTTNFPNQTRDVVRSILQYDPRSTFLNSPLARTLNFAFFPFRFNLKVTQIMARGLARSDALTQFAVIKGVMQASQFLKSPEGQAWYSQNSDVIGLFKYFSPLATISELSQALGQKPESVSQYGELGGLPFGWIPGLLDAEGITNTGQTYINPKTGVIAQDYVPVGSRGHALAAIEDFLGQIFTYPGSTIGLPSKTSIDVKVAQGLVPGSSSKDFNKTTPTLNAQQQQFQKAVQQQNGVPPSPDGLPNPAAFSSTNVPTQPTPITTPTPKAASTSSTKKKKSQFTPALLPGQSTLGQL